MFFLFFFSPSNVAFLLQGNENSNVISVIIDFYYNVGMKNKIITIEDLAKFFEKWLLAKLTDIFFPFWAIWK